MYLSRSASKRRLREAQNARNNRAEVVKALSHGQVNRRELVKWGIFTTAGLLAMKNGLNPFANSAFAGDDVPTGTPPSPLFGVKKFTQPMPRLNLQTPVPFIDRTVGSETECEWTGAYKRVGSNGERNVRRQSYHTDYSYWRDQGTPNHLNEFVNPVTGRGPYEGRPPGEYYAFQRWEEYTAQVGYVLSLGQVGDGIGFHPDLPYQDKNSVWSLNSGGLHTRGTLPPPLLKVRYGEPICMRVYNSLDPDRAQNNGFGRNETQIHFHNAHNGAESDGATNAFHFPGTFYDYHYSTTLARRDLINTDATEARASGPDGDGGLNYVPGDWRELQGAMWFHDHRFFFTAENVYKGNLGMINYYSGPDRGNELLPDGVNLRLPSGHLLDWGNVDFDVNLIISDAATDPEGQYFFDIFNTDGFLGDMMFVNFAYSPYMEVLPRKYRFRILNACMSRFIKLALADASGQRVRFQFIANDGNLVVHPLDLGELDFQGIAERYDIVIDFSQFNVGETVQFVNLSEHDDGRGPRGAFSLREALAEGSDKDPLVGKFMEFRVVSSVESVDEPGEWHHANDMDHSQVPATLTDQIPLVEPVRERFVEWKRGDGDSLDNPGGVCIPDCGEKESFPWVVRVNGEAAHSMNANRVSNLIPRPGETEQWTYKNGGGGWDHPIHLHFEEGITMNRGDDSIPETERLVRKDVWRLREGGTVQFQVTFGEYGGAYVNHCHNTVHEDFAMLMRYDILTGSDPNIGDDELHAMVIPTPNPTPDGVEYTTPEILPEGNPFDPNYENFVNNARSDDGDGDTGGGGDTGGVVDTSGAVDTGGGDTSGGRHRRRRRRQRS